MKNIVLSAVAVLAMSSFAVAGGDIAPVEEPVVVPEPVVTDSGFYLGLAYSLLDTSSTIRDTVTGDSETLWDTNFDDIMVQAGYKFNQYVAIEGRYWFGMDETINLTNGDTYDVSADAWGLYVKPMYPVTDAFDIYALLGYGSTSYDYSKKLSSHGFEANSSDDFDGFSWGLGAAYSFTDNVAVFVDYVSLYHETDGTNVADIDIDNDIDTWNFGVTYSF